MSERPVPLTVTAESRASSLEVRGPVSRSIGRAESSRLGTEAGPRTPGAGLTLRERRIKRILLKELEKISAKEYGSGLSYNEKQKLEKTLDAEFIDAELAKMDKAERTMQVVRNWLAIPLAVLATGVAIWAIASGEPLLDALFPAVTPLFLLFGFTQQSRATKRRRWIYEALRELSDADDLDVQLPESVALADLLIDRIVEAEDDASAVPLRRIRA
ncbi:MAG: hypothetical protein AAGI52_01905 [Bacteroidota bacterium]